MRKFYLVFGSIAIIALGSAAACTSDDGGSGGSGGGGDGGSATGTGTGTATGTGGSGTGTATGTGGSGTGTGGGDACFGCGDYLGDDTVALEDVCGVDSVDGQAGTFTCEAGMNSCSFLVDLQTCTCDPATCQADCTDACTGGAITNECLGCVTTQCNTEFNACSSDVQ